MNIVQYNQESIRQVGSLLNSLRLNGELVFNLDAIAAILNILNNPIPEKVEEGK